MRYLFALALGVLFSSHPAVAQNHEKEETIFRQAGNYSEKHDVLTIAVLRGTSFRDQYDKYLKFLEQKFDSLEVPFKFFIEEVPENLGTAFVYFIENDLNGPVDGNELYALLPHIKRRYYAQYPTSQK
ncbi:MAG: hypothetical protein R8G66_26080 [Cytophagales bacterium]|nr:hypothetical protein [Cytophagales bacterium]